MARIPRALLLIILLLLTACRFSPARREAIVRFAVSTILDFASGDEPVAAATPVHQASRCPRARQAVRAEACAVKPAAVRPKTAEESRSIPVRRYEIATSALRPAFDECDTGRRIIRIDLARLQTIGNFHQLAPVLKQSVRCREAELRAARVIEEELRAAHLLPFEGRNVCLIGPDDGPVPVLDMRVHRTIGG